MWNLVWKNSDRIKIKCICETEICISSRKTSHLQKRLLSGKCEICLQWQLCNLDKWRKIKTMGKVTMLVGYRKTHLILLFFFLLTPAICIASFLLLFFPLNFLSLSGVWLDMVAIYQLSPLESNKINFTLMYA